MGDGIKHAFLAFAQQRCVLFWEMVVRSPCWVTTMAMCIVVEECGEVPRQDWAHRDGHGNVP